MNVIVMPLVKEVSSVLHQLYGNRLLKLILYGSYARGDQREESDIDFIVILNEDTISPFKEIDFVTKPISKLSRKYDKYISVKAGGRNFLQNENSLFVHFVKKEGIAIA